MSVCRSSPLLAPRSQLSPSLPLTTTAVILHTHEVSQHPPPGPPSSPVGSRLRSHTRSPRNNQQQQPPPLNTYHSTTRSRANGWARNNVLNEPPPHHYIASFVCCRRPFTVPSKFRSITRYNPPSPWSSKDRHAISNHIQTTFCLATQYTPLRSAPLRSAPLRCIRAGFSTTYSSRIDRDPTKQQPLISPSVALLFVGYPAFSSLKEPTTIFRLPFGVFEDEGL